MGNCQNYGHFLGPYYNTGPNTGPNLGDPKRDHNFDNPPYDVPKVKERSAASVWVAMHMEVCNNWRSCFGGPGTKNPKP